MLSKIESKYSVTNLDDKAEDAENIELKRKKSDAPKIKKTLKLTGKSEYQISLRKRYAGAKANIKKLKQLTKQPLSIGSINEEIPRKREQK